VTFPNGPHKQVSPHAKRGLSPALCLACGTVASVRIMLRFLDLSKEESPSIQGYGEGVGQFSAQG